MNLSPSQDWFHGLFGFEEGDAFERKVTADVKRVIKGSLVIEHNGECPLHEFLQKKKVRRGLRKTVEALDHAEKHPDKIVVVKVRERRGTLAHCTHGAPYESPAWRG